MAVTAAPVTLNYDTWTQISNAAIQTIQVRSGQVGIIFSDTQPPPDNTSTEKMHLLASGQLFISNSGGTSWGKADNAGVGSAVVNVTED